MSTVVWKVESETDPGDGTLTVEVTVIRFPGALRAVETWLPQSADVPADVRDALAAWLGEAR